jgi:hypothetical protein
LRDQGSVPAAGLGFGRESYSSVPNSNAAAPGLETGSGAAHIQRMIQATLKIVGAALLVMFTGVWPRGRDGWVVVIGACIVIAGILHVVAP